jgi:hypothetical protein
LLSFDGAESGELRAESGRVSNEGDNMDKSSRCGRRERERFAVVFSEQSRVGFRDCVRSEEESSQPNCHQEFEGIRFFENFISHKNRVACDMNPMF